LFKISKEAIGGTLTPRTEELVDREIQKIREEFGDEVYEEHKEKIIKLIKTIADYPAKNTYSVKYLGVTEGKIGILSRKLPYPNEKGF
jgi:hypothetical protein